MDNYQINNLSYLRSLKSKFNILPYVLLVFILIIVVLLFIIKSYDVYTTKGYINCDEKCLVSVSIDYLNTSKINRADFIRINKENIKPNNVIVSDIKIDELSKSNYQIVSYEVDQLDNGIINTFQDVKIYSNKDLLINKIIKILF